MRYDYPILNKVFDFYIKNKNENLDDYKLYSCQHLLEPQLEMYKKFIDFGFLPENIFILGKIYSSNVEVIEEFRKMGISVEQPEFDNKSFNSQHIENCKKLIDKISDEAVNIILDDGAYLINEARSRNILFAVEQTSSGFRKLEKENLHFPVINVARSKTKLTQESPLIARLVAERIEDYLRNLNIKNPKFLIVGLGPIGDSVRQILDKDFLVLGIDREEGCDLTKKIKDNNIDVVVGATGSRVMNKKDIEKLNDYKKIHLISISSSDIEFPVEYFRTNEKPHDDVIYNNITFVNNGFPITFKGNRYESTPIEIEKTISLLMGSVFDGVLNKYRDSGLINVSDDLEELIS